MRAAVSRAADRCRRVGEKVHGGLAYTSVMEVQVCRKAEQYKMCFERG
jgi:hypothetical protein